MFVEVAGCPICGGALEHVTASRGPVGTQGAVVASCGACRREVAVFVRLELLPDEAAEQLAAQRAASAERQRQSRARRRAALEEQVAATG